MRNSHPVPSTLKTDQASLVCELTHTNTHTLLRNTFLKAASCHTVVGKKFYSASLKVRL